LGGEIIEIKINNTDFIIEKNIPIPGLRMQRIYPFKIMGIGDSFILKCPTDRKTRKNAQSSLMGIAKRYAAKMKFTTRSVKEGIRCWRVK